MSEYIVEANCISGKSLTELWLSQKLCWKNP